MTTRRNPPDDGKRNGTGLVVTAVPLPGRRVRIVLDDVRAASVPGEWKHQFLHTSAEVDADAFAEGRLPQDMLAQLGLAVVARLAARLPRPPTKAREPKHPRTARAVEPPKS